MAFEEQLPQWENEGTQPPQSKRVEGWLPNEKPPASWFNWLFGRTYRVLKELQEKAVEREEFESHASRHAAGGPDAITPAMIGAAPISHGSEHNHDGADPIPDLVQLRDDFDDYKNEINYEVGSWTPEYITTGNPFANISITARSSGTYIRIGRLVFIRFGISTDYLEKGNASGELRIAGLPFPYGETDTIRYTGLTITGVQHLEISPIENYYMWRMAVVPNSTEIAIFQNDPNSAFATAGPEILQDHTSGSNNVIRASGVYYTS